MRQPPALAAALALVMIVLAGCGGLPRETDVGRGSVIGAPELPQYVDRRFDEPTPGMTPAEVVHNFVLESHASSDNYRSARHYLAPRLTETWKPTVTTTIIASAEALQVTATSASRVTVSAAQYGSLTADGHLVESAPGTTASMAVTLTQVAGEWRIESLPPAFSTWITRADFFRIYYPLSIAYGVRHGVGAVMDPRWFAAGPRLATAVTRATIGAVPEYLAQAVRTGFPPDTSLAVDAVRVDRGLATVELTERFLQQTQAVPRALALEQLYVTLTKVPGINNVEVKAGGHRVEVPEGEIPGGGQGTLAGGVPPIPTMLLARRGNTLVPDFSERPVDELPAKGIQAPGIWATIPAGLAHVAVEKSMKAWSGIVGGSVVTSRGDQRWTTAVPAKQLNRPSFDSDGNVWVTGADTQGRATAWRISYPRPGASTVTQVALSWPGRGRLLGARVARDGVRVVVWWTDEQGASHVGMIFIVV